MSARVYVLLDVEQGKSAKVVRALRGQPGVIMADVIEGPPDVVMVVEAQGRRRLAELTVNALSSIESMTKDLQLLPVTADGNGFVSMTFAHVPESRNRMMSFRTGEKVLTHRNTAKKDMSIKLRKKVKGNVPSRLSREEARPGG